MCCLRNISERFCNLFYHWRTPISPLFVLVMTSVLAFWVWLFLITVIRRAATIGRRECGVEFNTYIAQGNFTNNFYFLHAQHERHIKNYFNQHCTQITHIPYVQVPLLFLYWVKKTMLHPFRWGNTFHTTFIN